MADPITSAASAHRRLATVQRCAAHLGQVVGYASALFMVLMSLSIILGIVMRTARIDNSWTYDVDLFALIWLAFIGASFTALRREHVTSGIALENMYPRAATLLMALRFAIIAIFLVVFTISGFEQFLSSVQTHETTLDIMSWPVWIPHLALPVGTILWLIFETHHFLAALTTRRA